MRNGECTVCPLTGIGMLFKSIGSGSRKIKENIEPNLHILIVCRASTREAALEGLAQLLTAGVCVEECSQRRVSHQPKFWS